MGPFSNFDHFDISDPNICISTFLAYVQLTIVYNISFGDFFENFENEIVADFSRISIICIEPCDSGG